VSDLPSVYGRQKHYFPPDIGSADTKAAPKVEFGPTGYFAKQWIPTPRPHKPDPSVLPIAADEPIVPVGFPVLPDRLDLPSHAEWFSKPAMAEPGPVGNHGGYQHVRVPVKSVRTARGAANDREPKLDPDTDYAVSPPQAVTINQSVTQELTGPDAERKPVNGKLGPRRMLLQEMLRHAGDFPNRLSPDIHF
jgi:hypothetical protein